MKQVPLARGARLGTACALLSLAATVPAAAQNFPPGTNCRTLLPSLRATCMTQVQQMNSGVGTGTVVPNSAGANTVTTPGTNSLNSGVNSGVGVSPSGVAPTTVSPTGTGVGPSTVSPTGTSVTPSGVTNPTAPDGTLNPNVVSPNSTINPNAVGTPGSTISPNAVDTPNSAVPSANPVITPPAGTGAGTGTTGTGTTGTGTSGSGTSGGASGGGASGN